MRAQTEDLWLHRWQKAVVFSSEGATPCVPLRQVGKLRMEEPGLKSIETSVVAFYIVEVLFCLAVIAKSLDFACHIGVIRCDCSAFAAGPEVLPG